MAYGFSGSVGEFAAVARAGGLGQALSRQREDNGAYPLSRGERDIWDRDGIVVASALDRSDVPPRDTYLMLLEYDVPGHLGRCDLILLGGDRGRKKHAGVFELKRWERFDDHEPPWYVRIGGRLHLHPSEQALHYRDLLRYFHEQGAEFSWHAAAWMTTMRSPEVERLGQNAPQDSPVWSLSNPGHDFFNHLAEWFGGGLDSTAVRRFRDARCLPSAALADKLFMSLPHLTRGVSKAISGQPLDLSPRQEEVVSAIMRSVRSHDRTLVMVSGSPGCGKTVVGINALVHATLHSVGDDRLGRRPSVLALRNNRLCTVVRSAIDNTGERRKRSRRNQASADAKVGRALVQYVKGGGPGVGIQPRVQSLWGQRETMLPCFELVVVDEAHRVPHGRRSHPDKPTQLEAVLSAGRVVTCLIDDKQVLNEDDNGTCETVRNTWRSLFPDAPIVHLDLSEQYRVPESYAAWLEEFLSGRPGPVPTDYDFRVASNEREVVDYLRSHSREVVECPNSPSQTPQCGLLASYTVCNGRLRKNRRGRNDLRVPALGIRWLMAKEEYNLWWRNPARRHTFDRCASVYGCQGFELDYAGVFWGRDLALRMRGGHIELDLCQPHDIKDDIGTAYGTKFYKLADLASSPGQEALLEDAETAKVLRACLKSGWTAKGSSSGIEAGQ